MNYSAYYPIILQRYLPGVFIVIGLVIACLIGLIKLIKEHKRNKKEFDYAVVIVVSIMMLVMLYLFGMPYIKTSFIAASYFSSLANRNLNSHDDFGGRSLNDLPH